jgi:hypothetical protein
VRVGNDLVQAEDMSRGAIERRGLAAAPGRSGDGNQTLDGSRRGEQLAGGA